MEEARICVWCHAEIEDDEQYETTPNWNYVCERCSQGPAETEPYEAGLMVPDARGEHDESL